MRRLSLFALHSAAALLFVGVAWLGACSPEPVNAEGCEAIENARCEAAPACPDFPNFDVDACKRFYHDQCLHGLASANDPGQPKIERCVTAINKAAACARAGSAACETGAATISDPCDLIEHPEKYEECSFLVPPVEEPEDAAVEASTDGETDGGESEAGEEAGGD